MCSIQVNFVRKPVRRYFIIGNLKSFLFIIRNLSRLRVCFMVSRESCEKFSSVNVVFSTGKKEVREMSFLVYVGMHFEYADIHAVI